MTDFKIIRPNEGHTFIKNDIIQNFTDRSLDKFLNYHMAKSEQLEIKWINLLTDERRIFLVSKVKEGALEVILMKRAHDNRGNPLQVNSWKILENDDRYELTEYWGKEGGLMGISYLDDYVCLYNHVPQYDLKEYVNTLHTIFNSKDPMAKGGFASMFASLCVACKADTDDLFGALSKHQEIF